MRTARLRAWLGAALLPAAAALATPGAEIRPNENLVAEGIPPIPASLAEATARYTELRSASVQTWHPWRREMLILTRFADTNQVHQVRMPGGARRQLTFYPDRVTGATYEPDTGDFFVLARDLGGNEFTQLYRYDLPGGAVTLLTDGKSQNGGVVWSTTGGRIAYGTTRRNGKDRDLHVQDPRRPESDRRLAELEGGGWQALDWSPDDRRILAGEFVSANESYLWLFDAATGARTALTPRGGTETVAYDGGAFAADGRAVYVATDRDSEFLRLARVDLASGQHTYLTSHISWDVDLFELSPDGRTVAFVTNEDGVSVLRLLETATGQERARPSPLGLGVISRIEWHRNSRDLAFTFSSARSPADAYSLDAETGRFERWTESETGGMDPAAFSEPELVHWKTFDGRSISGFLYRPPPRFGGPRPVIINIHGGPEAQYRPGFLGRSNYYLNELGVAVLFPNVRGSTGYGKTFLKLDNGLLREDSVKDIGALLDWIATRRDLDARRVMVTGGSYGGYMALAVAVHYGDRIRSALDVVGVSNFVTFLENTEAYRRDLRRAEYGDERDPRIREFLTRTAPVNNAHRITKPLFVVQGKNDPRVPLSESEQMVATMRKGGRPVWWLMANDEGHGFQKKKNQDFLFYATVAFVQQHLLGGDAGSD